VLFSSKAALFGFARKILFWSCFEDAFKGGIFPEARKAAARVTGPLSCLKLEGSMFSFFIFTSRR
jgi:hypothetical protein